MSREEALAKAAGYFDGGGYFDDLARRVAIPSTAQVAAHRPALYAYLGEEIGPWLERLGYASEIIENPVEGAGPLLLAERHEGDEGCKQDAERPTVHVRTRPPPLSRPF